METPTASSEPGVWLTIRQIARELQMGTKSIYAAINSGELRAAHINDRKDFRIHRSWLTAWLERRADAPRPVKRPGTPKKAAHDVK